MDKPTTPEMRKWLKAGIAQCRNSTMLSRDHAILSALLELLAEPQPAAGKVSREEKQEAALSMRNIVHARWMTASKADRDYWRKITAAADAILADYAEPVLPEGWEIERTDDGRFMTLIKSGDPFYSYVMERLCDLDGTPSLPVRLAWHLACADAIAQAIAQAKEEGGDDD